MRLSVSASLYRRAWEVCGRRPRLALGLVLGSILHAVGHALFAAAAGFLARKLAGDTPPMDGRSSWNALPSALSLGGPVALAAVGTVAAGVKLVGNVLAAFCEARLGGEVSRDLREDVLVRVLAPGVHPLRPARQLDHGGDEERLSSAQPRSGATGWAEERATDPGSNGSTGPAQGQELASLTSHVGEVERGMVEGVFAEVRGALQLVPLAVLLVVLAPRSASFALVVLGSFALALGAYRRSLKRGHAVAARKREALLAAADEAVRHADLWATYGAEERVRRHLASLDESLAYLEARLRAGAALVSGTSEVLGALAVLSVLGLVASGWMPELRSERLLPFAIVFFMAYRPLRDVADARLAKARAIAALDRIHTLHSHVYCTECLPAGNMPSDGQSLASERRPKAGKGAHAWGSEALVLDRVHTIHGRHAPVSLRIPFGSIVVLVGPTGVGKTSLLRALLGLDPLRGGRLHWGTQDLTGCDVGPQARPFAWAPQAAPVLADTIEANVLLGEPVDPGHEEASRRTQVLLDALGGTALAASTAGAVLVAEREVSGGERQWISVARALASAQPVLLLDEPTSSLDPTGQAAMLSALSTLRGERTVLLITHRTEPLAIADVVVRLAPESPVLGASSAHVDEGKSGAGLDG